MFEAFIHCFEYPPSQLMVVTSSPTAVSPIVETKLSIIEYVVEVNILHRFPKDEYFMTVCFLKVIVFVIDCVIWF